MAVLPRLRAQGPSQPANRVSRNRHRTKVKLNTSLKHQLKDSCRRKARAKHLFKLQALPKFHKLKHRVRFNRKDNPKQ